MYLQGTPGGETKAIASGSRILKMSRESSTVPFDSGEIISILVAWSLSTFRSNILHETCTC